MTDGVGGYVGEDSRPNRWPLTPEELTHWSTEAQRRGGLDKDAADAALDGLRVRLVVHAEGLDLNEGMTFGSVLSRLERLDDQQIRDSFGAEVGAFVLALVRTQL